MKASDSVGDFSIHGEMFHMETTQHVAMPKPTKKEVEIVVGEPEVLDMSPRDMPITLIFGWGGSSHKKVAKYASIYQKAGCTTVQYILPIRHLFRDTEQIPDIMDNVLTQLEEYNILNRPVYIHCLCDTGVMCYQGLDIAARRSGRNLNIQGVVWDSCPGPFPEVTVIGALVFTCVWILSCARYWATGEVSFKDAVSSAVSWITDRVIPAFLRKWQGKPFIYSLIQGVWAGTFGRDHYMNRVATPELFLYSDNDFYLPLPHMEGTVLALRQKFGAPFRAVMFEGSPHVAHLRDYSEVYTQEILRFVTKDSQTRQNENESILF